MKISKGFLFLCDRPFSCRYTSLSFFQLVVGLLLSVSFLFFLSSNFGDLLYQYLCSPLEASARTNGNQPHDKGETEIKQSGHFTCFGFRSVLDLYN